MNPHRTLYLAALTLLLAPGALPAAQPLAAPKFRFDPDWPKPLPNKWKLGGVTGLAVDKDDNVWVYDRPNDLTDIELEAELNPPLADCCVRPPAMIHIDKQGNVIGSFDAPQGHGMAVDSKGFVYLGQDTVRKYDPQTGRIVGEVPRTPERPPGAGADPAPTSAHIPGHGSQGPVAGFITPPGGRGQPNASAATAREAATAAFRAKYPPTTPMIVGGIEEIRLDEPAHELYAADNYLGGRVMVFDLDTLQFKRGWGAYGHKLSEMTTTDADRAYTPGGPMPKEFRGHLTLNISNDGLVYAADRNANRIHVTTKEGKFLKRIHPRAHHGGWRIGRRRDVLSGQSAAASLHLRSHQQPPLVPQPRGRQGHRPDGFNGRKRRPVLRTSYDRRRLERRPLHRRSLPG